MPPQRGHASPEHRPVPPGGAVDEGNDNEFELDSQESREARDVARHAMMTTVTDDEESEDDMEI